MTFKAIVILIVLSIAVQALRHRQHLSISSL